MAAFDHCVEGSIKFALKNKSPVIRNGNLGELGDRRLVRMLPTAEMRVSRVSARHLAPEL